jgi:hypothetical protein
MMEYDELTDCMICPQLATDRDDALARVNELESLLCVEVNGGEFEPISSAYRPEGVMLVEAEIRRGHEAAAELAALKARRCDGCAWATPLGDPEYIACRREGDRPVDWYCADFTPRTAS